MRVSQTNIVSKTKTTHTKFCIKQTVYINELSFNQLFQIVFIPLSFLITSYYNVPHNADQFSHLADKVFGIISRGTQCLDELYLFGGYSQYCEEE